LQNLNLGLSVVYLAGRSPSSGLAAGVYSEDDIDAVRAFAEEPGIVDLFLTYPCVPVEENTSNSENILEVNIKAA